MSPRWLQSAAIAVALLASADRARAAPTARVAWARLDDAGSCADGRAIERSVARRLGRDPFVANDAPTVVAEGAVRRTSARWQVDLAFRDAAGHPSGERHLTSTDASCSAVTEATVLALALAIDPEAALRPPSALDASTPDATPGAPTASATAVVPATARDLAPRVEASGVVTAGVLPSVSAGAAIGFSVGLTPAWRVGLRGVVLPEARTDEGAFGFGISSAVVSTELRLLHVGVLSLGATAGAWGGVFHTYVHPFPGLAAVAPGDYAWAAIDGGAVATVELLPRFDLAFAARGLIPLTRTRALVRGDARPAFEEPLAGFLGELTAGMRF